MVSDSKSSCSMGLEEDKVSRKRSSSACLHCDFRSDSPSVLTQHLWENHPLRMRRKQHLFGALKSNNRSCPKETVPEKLNEADVDPRTPESISSDNDGISEQPVPIAQIQSISNHRTAQEHGKRNDKIMSPFVIPSHAVQSSIYPHLNQAGSIFIPSQFVSIPFANSTMVQHLTRPIHASQLEKVNAYHLANALNLQFRQNEMNLAINMALKQNTSDVINSSPSSSPNSHFNQQLVVPTSNVSAYSSAHNSISSSSISQNKLLASQSSDSNSKTLTWQSNRSHGHEKSRPKHGAKVDSDKRPLGKTFTTSTDASSNSLIDNQRLLALEEALQSVCFYDVNDTSSVMPFKCPDNVWRMVRFKCIKGVWLVQLPDSDNPTLYVPFQKSADRTHSCLRDALQQSLRNKSYNPLFNLFNSTGTKRIECPMIHPGASANTKRPVEMFTNVERSEVKAKRVQQTMKTGDLLKSLLSGRYDGVRATNSSYGRSKLGDISPHLNNLPTYNKPVTKTVC